MAQKDSFITMGNIIHPFGIKGWLKIRALPDSVINQSSDIYLSINGVWTKFEVEHRLIQNKLLHLKLVGINDRDQALSLRGVEIAIPRDTLPKPEEDEYYWIDLIGLKVYNLKDEFLGVVSSLMETGANSVLVIKNDVKTHLVPFVKIYVLNVDFVKRQIIVDWELDY